MRIRLFALCMTAALLTTLMPSSNPAVAAPADVYADTVMSDSPSIWYRLNETGGTAVADSSGNGRSASLVNGGINGAPVPNAAGGPSQSSGRSMTMTNCGFVANSFAFSNNNIISQELWFKTATTSGGNLTMYSDNTTGSSSAYDRNLAMNDNGTVSFFVYAGLGAIMSARSYNDNTWHHIAGVLGPAGMFLYVDGGLVASNANTAGQPRGNGYWRLGCDRTTGAFTNRGFEGQVDDAALYIGTQLTAARIAAHYAAAFAGSSEAVVSTTVDPSLAFTVSGRSTTCNGETRTGTATGSSVSLGRVSAGSRGSAGQDFLVSSNAASGWQILVSTAGPPSDGRGNNIPYVSSGSAAPFPSLGTAAFGYAFEWMADDAWSQPAPYAAPAFIWNGPGAPTGMCVAYQAQAASTTPAGNFATTVIWNLVPQF